MGEVNVDDLKCGMVLATDLKDSRGRFLLGQGTVIAEKHLRIMKMWGVTGVDIEGANRDQWERESLEQFEPTVLEKAGELADRVLYNSVKRHDGLRELRRLCVLRFSRELSRADKDNTDETNVEKPEPPAKNGKTMGFGWTAPAEEIIPVNDLVERSIKLSSFPDIYYKIIEVINDPHSSASRLADVVSKDTGLSASLLKLVNSAFYGLPAKVDSITRAIALIGSRELSTLAMAISVIRFFKDIPPDVVDMKSFWLHSIACGVFARVLADRKVDLPDEQFFIGGLLHDIGRLILFKALPKTTAYMIRQAGERQLPLYMVEQEVLGYDHTRVAGLLLENWNFPKTLVHMIRYHHSPLSCHHSLPPAVILVSDIMAVALRIGSSGSEFASAFLPKVWETVNLSPTVLAPSIHQADRQVNEILNAFRLNEN